MSYSTFITSLSPTLWYKCDEVSGNLTDSGSYGLTLTGSGVPVYDVQPEFLNEPGVIDFSDGVSFFSGIASTAITTVTGTLFAWVDNPGSSASSPVVFHLGDNAIAGRPGFYLRVNPSGNYRIEYYDTTNAFRAVDFTAHTAKTDGAEFIAIKWSGNPVELKLFVDGVIADTQSGINGFQTPTGQHYVRIASLKSGTTSVAFQWPGRVSNLSYFESEIADSDILTAYNEGVAGIQDPPTITLDPVAQTVTEGDNAVFTADATGAPEPTYQWYEVSEGAIFGETTKTLTLTAVELADSGRQFYWGAENTNGVVYTLPALLTVNPLLTALTVQSVEQLQGVEPLPLGFFTEYPDSFPCPTWDYTQTGDLFHERTEFDSGWTRQRRRWLDNLYVVNMVFDMDTQMFHDWTTWVETYGRQYFLMDFDQAGTFLAAEPIRFISDISWQYIEHDRVVARVSAEFKRG